MFNDFPKLESRLLSMTANELATAQVQMLLLGQKSARERVASFLLRSARRAERRGENGRSLDLPMTRIDLADYLGLSMETVCRTFSAFRKEGLIEYDKRTPVILRQRELLESIAENS